MHYWRWAGLELASEPVSLQAAELMVSSGTSNSSRVGWAIQHGEGECCVIRAEPPVEWRADRLLPLGGLCLGGVVADGNLDISNYLNDVLQDWEVSPYSPSALDIVPRSLPQPIS